MPSLRIDRATLAKIAPNPQSLRALEQAFNDLSGMPSTIEEAAAQANQAIAMAASLLSFAQDLASQLEALSTAPASIPAQEVDDTAPRWPEPVEQDDTAPRVQLGTISSQDAEHVDIDGGSIDGTEIGGDVPAAAAFTTIAASGVIASSVATGTAPLIVASTTRVDNLHVARASLADAADSLTSPSSYPADATDLSTAITLVNALKSAALSKGM